MKKVFVVSVFFLLISHHLMADGTDREPVVIHVLETDEASGGEEIHRAPVKVPVLYLNNNVLSFTSSCIGCALQLWCNEVLIYTYNIEDESSLELPIEAGEYELFLVKGTLTFVGTIDILET